MRPLLLSLLLIFFNSVHSFSQMIPIGHDTLEYKTQVVLSGGFDYAGNSVERDLTSKFLRGGEITDNIKDASYAKHGSVNRLGGILTGEISYAAYNVRLLKNKNWGLLFKGGYDIFGGLVYSKDFFGLAFYGNQRYLGDTLSMSGMSAKMVGFQKIGFGMISAKSKSSLTLNFYNIDNYFDGHFRTMELIQDENGDSFQIEMDGEASVAKNSKFNQGFGVGFDFDFRLPISWSAEKTAYVQFQAKNIGVGISSQPYQRYYTDTTISFSGFTFDQLIGDNSLIGDTSITVNSVMDSIGVYSENHRPVYMLPGIIQIAKIVDEHSDSKFQPFFGIRLYPTLIYSPMVFGGLDFKAWDKVRFGANLSFGGFAGLRGGLYSQAKFGKWSLGLSTETLSGLVSKKASGQSVYFRVGCAF